jgi:hypothetical protein
VDGGSKTRLLLGGDVGARGQRLGDACPGGSRWWRLLDRGAAMGSTKRRVQKGTWPRRMTLVEDKGGGR